MIDESIKRSITAIQRKRSAQESKLSAETQTAALAQLDAVCKQARALLECCAAIRQSGISEESPLSDGIRRELADSISACGNAVTDRALSKDTVSVLSSTVKTAANEAGQVWRARAASYAEGARGYLSLIAGLTADPRGAGMLADRISDTCNSPPTARGVRTLITDVSKAQEIISRFSIKPEIEAFLKKVSSRQATVFDLTPEVLSWLKEQGLSGKLKVNF